MESRKREKPRQLVREALSCYAKCFENIASGQIEESRSQLIRELEVLDGRAQQSLDEEQREYFLRRSQYLSHLFSKELVVRLQGQVRDEVIQQVQSLSEQLEKQLDPK